MATTVRKGYTKTVKTKTGTKKVLVPHKVVKTTKGTKRK